MGESAGTTRGNEWYVPRFGSRRFRLLVGMTFLPYTLMNVSYVAIGSLLAPTVHLDRLGAMALVYLLAVGVTAHALDAMAPNKPWGTIITEFQFLAIALAALVPALAIGLYYSLFFAPLLILVGIPELFFLAAYNLELFKGRFHTEAWFAFSWGFLPVLAGFVVQTNTLSLAPLAGGVFGFLTAYVEANASRPYKALRKSGIEGATQEARRFENILKGVSGTVVCAALLLAFLRFLG